jgi:hypothetical protein
MRPTLAIPLCAALLVSMGAQAASLDGRWTVTTEAARGTTDNGSNWSLGALTGRADAHSGRQRHHRLLEGSDAGTVGSDRPAERPRVRAAN